MARKHDKRGVFQSTDVWVSALLTIPDALFFEMARNTLGAISTPFNKQRIVEELIAFLSGEEVQKNVRAYIDEVDHKIIAAIALLAEPELKDLEAFFANEFSPARLGALILNLEERLIVFRRTSQMGSHVNRVLSLNPVLEKTLAPFAGDKNILFPARPLTEEEARLPASFPKYEPSCAVIAAILAYIEQERGIFKTTGEFRKKVQAETRWIFGQYDVEKWIHIFLRLSILTEDEAHTGALSVNWDSVFSFAASSERDRRVYIAAAMYMNETSNDWSKHNYTLDQRLSRFASFFASLFRGFEFGKAYPELVLTRRVQVMENDPRWISYENADKIKFDLLLPVLEAAGLLAKTGEDYTPVQYASPPPHEGGHSKNPSGFFEMPYIIFDSSFTLYMLPEIAFADSVRIASFCSLSGLENAPAVEEQEAAAQGAEEIHFEVTREAVVRSFERGFDSQAISALLKKVSAGRVSESLEWQLNEWKERYKEAALFEGLTLSLAPERRYVTEVEPLSSMIQETTAPGVYILNTKDKEAALRALGKAGVEIVRTPSVLPPLWERPQAKSFLQGLDSHSENGEEAEAGAASSYENTDERKAAFRRVLGEREKLFTKNEHDELAARIERRLIVANGQLTINQMHLEKLEARGLDFSGKSNVVRTAMAKNSLLEITINLDGEMKTIIGTPRSIERRDSEQILVFSGVDGENIRVSLGKISVARRIKNSVFE